MTALKNKIIAGRALPFSIIVMMLYTLPGGAFPQTPVSPAIKDSDCLEAEITLRPIAQQILYGENDSVKNEASRIFTVELGKVLAQPGSFFYPFDSLVTIARLYAPDSTFRILNWNMPLSNGSYRYFAMIQMNTEPARIFILNDISDTLPDEVQAITRYPDWYGALYYRIILNESEGRDYYTLLGWDGYSPRSTRKMIDVLSFSSSGEPEFGAPLFRDHGDGKNTRILFEHAENASMSLKYDYQTYHISLPSGKNKSRFKVVDGWMIVFDHLVPMDPTLTGQFNFYIPSGLTYDAFVFYDGYWHFHENVDARNPESPENSSRSKEKIEYQLFPPSKEPPR